MNIKEALLNQQLETQHCVSTLSYTTLSTLAEILANPKMSSTERVTRALSTLGEFDKNLNAIAVERLASAIELEDVAVEINLTQF